MLVSGCIMNRACFAFDTDGIGYETALPVLVLGCVVNRACFAVDTDGIGFLKLLRQCLCRGTW